MKIVGVCPEEDDDMLVKLSRLYYLNKVKMIRNGITFFIENGSDISALPKKCIYYLSDWEEGGGKTNVGLSKIICGNHGERLVPIETRVGGELSNSHHAKFMYFDLVVIISTKRGEIKILKNEIMKNGFIFSNTELIWSGKKELLPNKFSHFSHAVQSAYEKANCFHCRHVHYQYEIKG